MMMQKQFERVELTTVTLNEGMGAFEMNFDVSTIYDVERGRYETVVFGPNGSIAEAKALTESEALYVHNELEAMLYHRKLDFDDYAIVRF